MFIKVTVTDFSKGNCGTATVAVNGKFTSHIYSLGT